MFGKPFNEPDSKAVCIPKRTTSRRGQLKYPYCSKIPPNFCNQCIEGDFNYCYCNNRCNYGHDGYYDECCSPHECCSEEAFYCNCGRHHCCFCPSRECIHSNMCNFCEPNHCMSSSPSSIKNYLTSCLETPCNYDFPCKENVCKSISNTSRINFCSPKYSQPNQDVCKSSSACGIKKSCTSTPCWEPKGCIKKPDCWCCHKTKSNRCLKPGVRFCDETSCTDICSQECNECNSRLQLNHVSGVAWLSNDCCEKGALNLQLQFKQTDQPFDVNRALTDSQNTDKYTLSTIKGRSIYIAEETCCPSSEQFADNLDIDLDCPHSRTETTCGSQTEKSFAKSSNCTRASKRLQTLETVDSTSQSACSVDCKSQKSQTDKKGIRSVSSRCDNKSNKKTISINLDDGDNLEPRRSPVSTSCKSVSCSGRNKSVYSSSRLDAPASLNELSVDTCDTDECNCSEGTDCARRKKPSASNPIKSNVEVFNYSQKEVFPYFDAVRRNPERNRYAHTSNNRLRRSKPSVQRITSIDSLEKEAYFYPEEGPSPFRRPENMPDSLHHRPESNQPRSTRHSRCESSNNPTLASQRSSRSGSCDTEICDCEHDNMCIDRKSTCSPTSSKYRDSYDYPGSDTYYCSDFTEKRHEDDYPTLLNYKPIVPDRDRYAYYPQGSVNTRRSRVGSVSNNKTLSFEDPLKQQRIYRLDNPNMRRNIVDDRAFSHNSRSILRSYSGPDAERNIPSPHRINVRKSETDSRSSYPRTPYIENLSINQQGSGETQRNIIEDANSLRRGSLFSDRDKYSSLQKISEDDRLSSLKSDSHSFQSDRPNPQKTQSDNLSLSRHKTPSSVQDSLKAVSYIRKLAESFSSYLQNSVGARRNESHTQSLLIANGTDPINVYENIASTQKTKEENETTSSKQESSKAFHDENLIIRETGNENRLQQEPITVLPAISTSYSFKPYHMYKNTKPRQRRQSTSSKTKHQEIYTIVTNHPSRSNISESKTFSTDKEILLDKYYKKYPIDNNSVSIQCKNEANATAEVQAPDLSSRRLLKRESRGHSSRHRHPSLSRLTRNSKLRRVRKKEAEVIDVTPQYLGFYKRARRRDRRKKDTSSSGHSSKEKYSSSRSSNGSFMSTLSCERFQSSKPSSSSRKGIEHSPSVNRPSNTDDFQKFSHRKRQGTFRPRKWSPTFNILASNNKLNRQLVPVFTTRAAPVKSISDGGLIWIPNHGLTKEPALVRSKEILVINAPKSESQLPLASVSTLLGQFLYSTPSPVIYQSVINTKNAISEKQRSIKDTLVENLNKVKPSSKSNSKKASEMSQSKPERHQSSNTTNATQPVKKEKSSSSKQLKKQSKHSKKSSQETQPSLSKADKIPPSKPSLSSQNRTHSGRKKKASRTDQDQSSLSKQDKVPPSQQSLSSQNRTTSEQRKQASRTANENIPPSEASFTNQSKVLSVHEKEESRTNQEKIPPSQFSLKNENKTLSSDKKNVSRVTQEKVDQQSNPDTQEKNISQPSLTKTSPRPSAQEKTSSRINQVETSIPEKEASSTNQEKLVLAPEQQTSLTHKTLSKSDTKINRDKTATRKNNHIRYRNKRGSKALSSFHNLPKHPQSSGFLLGVNGHTSSSSFKSDTSSLSGGERPKIKRKKCSKCHRKTQSKLYLKKREEKPLKKTCTKCEKKVQEKMKLRKSPIYDTESTTSSKSEADSVRYIAKPKPGFFSDRSSGSVPYWKVESAHTLKNPSGELPLPIVNEKSLSQQSSLIKPTDPSMQNVDVFPNLINTQTISVQYVTLTKNETTSPIPPNINRNITKSVQNRSCTEPNKKLPLVKFLDKSPATDACCGLSKETNVPSSSKQNGNLYMEKCLNVEEYESHNQMSHKKALPAMHQINCNITAANVATSTKSPVDFEYHAMYDNVSKKTAYSSQERNDCIKEQKRMSTSTDGSNSDREGARSGNHSEQSDSSAMTYLSHYRPQKRMSSIPKASNAPSHTSSISPPRSFRESATDPVIKEESPDASLKYLSSAQKSPGTTQPSPTTSRTSLGPCKVSSKHDSLKIEKTTSTLPQVSRTTATSSIKTTPNETDYSNRLKKSNSSETRESPCKRSLARSASTSATEIATSAFAKTEDVATSIKSQNEVASAYSPRRISFTDASIITADAYKAALLANSPEKSKLSDSSSIISDDYINKIKNPKNASKISFLKDHDSADTYKSHYRPLRILPKGILKSGSTSRTDIKSVNSSRKAVETEMTSAISEKEIGQQTTIKTSESRESIQKNKMTDSSSQKSQSTGTQSSINESTSVYNSHIESPNPSITKSPTRSLGRARSISETIILAGSPTDSEDQHNDNEVNSASSGSKAVEGSVQTSPNKLGSPNKTSSRKSSSNSVETYVSHLRGPSGSATSHKTDKSATLERSNNKSNEKSLDKVQKRQVSSSSAGEPPGDPYRQKSFVEKSVGSLELYEPLAKERSEQSSRSLKLGERPTSAPTMDELPTGRHKRKLYSEKSCGSSELFADDTKKENEVTSTSPSKKSNSTEKLPSIPSRTEISEHSSKRKSSTAKSSDGSDIYAKPAKEKSKTISTTSSRKSKNRDRLASTSETDEPPVLTTNKSIGKSHDSLETYKHHLEMKSTSVAEPAFSVSSKSIETSFKEEQKSNKSRSKGSPREKSLQSVKDKSIQKFPEASAGTMETYISHLRKHEKSEPSHPPQGSKSVSTPTVDITVESESASTISETLTLDLYKQMSFTDEKEHSKKAATTSVTESRLGYRKKAESATSPPVSEKEILVHGSDFDSIKPGSTRGSQKTVTTTATEAATGVLLRTLDDMEFEEETDTYDLPTHLDASIDAHKSHFKGKASSTSAHVYGNLSGVSAASDATATGIFWKKPNKISLESEDKELNMTAASDATATGIFWKRPDKISLESEEKILRSAADERKGSNSPKHPPKDEKLQTTSPRKSAAERHASTSPEDMGSKSKEDSGTNTNQRKEHRKQRPSTEEDRLHERKRRRTTSVSSPQRSRNLERSHEMKGAGGKSATFGKTKFPPGSEQGLDSHGPCVDFIKKIIPEDFKEYESNIKQRRWSRPTTPKNSVKYAEMPFTETTSKYVEKRTPTPTDTIRRPPDNMETDLTNKERKRTISIPYFKSRILTKSPRTSLSKKTPPSNTEYDNQHEENRRLSGRAHRRPRTPDTAIEEGPTGSITKIPSPKRMSESTNTHQHKGRSAGTSTAYSKKSGTTDEASTSVRSKPRSSKSPMISSEEEFEKAVSRATYKSHNKRHEDATPITSHRRYRSRERSIVTPPKETAFTAFTKTGNVLTSTSFDKEMAAFNPYFNSEHEKRKKTEKILSPLTSFENSPASSEREIFPSEEISAVSSRSEETIHSRSEDDIMQSRSELSSRGTTSSMLSLASVEGYPPTEKDIREKPPATPCGKSHDSKKHHPCHVEQNRTLVAQKLRSIRQHASPSASASISYYTDGTESSFISAKPNAFSRFSSNSTKKKLHGNIESNKEQTKIIHKIPFRRPETPTKPRANLASDELSNPKHHVTSTILENNYRRKHVYPVSKIENYQFHNKEQSETTSSPFENFKIAETYPILQKTDIVSNMLAQTPENSEPPIKTQNPTNSHRSSTNSSQGMSSGKESFCSYEFYERSRKKASKTPKEGSNPSKTKLKPSDTIENEHTDSEIPSTSCRYEKSFIKEFINEKFSDSSAEYEADSLFKNEKYFQKPDQKPKDPDKEIKSLKSPTVLIDTSPETSTTKVYTLTEHHSVHTTPSDRRYRDHTPRRVDSRELPTYRSARRRFVSTSFHLNPMDHIPSKRAAAASKAARKEEQQKKSYSVPISSTGFGLKLTPRAKVTSGRSRSRKSNDQEYLPSTSNAPPVKSRSSMPKKYSESAGFSIYSGQEETCSKPTTSTATPLTSEKEIDCIEPSIGYSDREHLPSEKEIKCTEPSSRLSDDSDQMPSASETDIHDTAETYSCTNLTKARENENVKSSASKLGHKVSFSTSGIVINEATQSHKALSMMSSNAAARDATCIRWPIRFPIKWPLGLKKDKSSTKQSGKTRRKVPSTGSRVAVARPPYGGKRYKRSSKSEREAVSADPSMYVEDDTVPKPPGRSKRRSKGFPDEGLLEKEAIEENPHARPARKLLPTRSISELEDEVRPAEVKMEEENVKPPTPSRRESRSRRSKRDPISMLSVYDSTSEITIPKAKPYRPKEKNNMSKFFSSMITPKTEKNQKRLHQEREHTQPPFQLATKITDTGTYDTLEKGIDPRRSPTKIERGTGSLKISFESIKEEPEEEGSSVVSLSKSEAELGHSGPYIVGKELSRIISSVERSEQSDKRLSPIVSMGSLNEDIRYDSYSKKAKVEDPFGGFPLTQNEGILCTSSFTNGTKNEKGFSKVHKGISPRHSIFSFEREETCQTEPTATVENQTSISKSPISLVICSSSLSNLMKDAKESKCCVKFDEEISSMSFPTTIERETSCEHTAKVEEGTDASFPITVDRQTSQRISSRIEEGTDVISLTKYPTTVDKHTSYTDRTRVDRGTEAFSKIRFPTMERHTSYREPTKVEIGTEPFPGATSCKTIEKQTSGEKHLGVEEGTEAIRGATMEKYTSYRGPTKTETGTEAFPGARFPKTVERQTSHEDPLKVEEGIEACPKTTEKYTSCREPSFTSRYPMTFEKQTYYREPFAKFGKTTSLDTYKGYRQTSQVERGTEAVLPSKHLIDKQVDDRLSCAKIEEGTSMDKLPSMVSVSQPERELRCFNIGNQTKKDVSPKCLKCFDNSRTNKGYKVEKSTKPVQFSVESFKYNPERNIASKPFEQELNSVSYLNIQEEEAPLSVDKSVASSRSCLNSEIKGRRSRSLSRNRNKSSCNQLSISATNITSGCTMQSLTSTESAREYNHSVNAMERRKRPYKSTTKSEKVSANLDKEEVSSRPYSAPVKDRSSGMSDKMIFPKRFEKSKESTSFPAESFKDDFTFKSDGKSSKFKEKADFGKDTSFGEFPLTMKKETACSTSLIDLARYEELSRSCEFYKGMLMNAPNLSREKRKRINAYKDEETEYVKPLSLSSVTCSDSSTEICKSLNPIIFHADVEVGRSSTKFPPVSHEERSLGQDKLPKETKIRKSFYEEQNEAGISTITISNSEKELGCVDLSRKEKRRRLPRLPNHNESKIRSEATPASEDKETLVSTVTINQSERELGCIDYSNYLKKDKKRKSRETVKKVPSTTQQKPEIPTTTVNKSEDKLCCLNYPDYHVDEKIECKYACNEGIDISMICINQSPDAPCNIPKKIENHSDAFEEFPISIPKEATVSLVTISHPEKELGFVDYVQHLKQGVRRPSISSTKQSGSIGSGPILKSNTVRDQKKRHPSAVSFNVSESELGSVNYSDFSERGRPAVKRSSSNIEQTRRLTSRESPEKTMVSRSTSYSIQEGPSSKSLHRHSSTTASPRPSTRSPSRHASTTDSPRASSRSPSQHASTTASPRASSRSPSRHSSTTVLPRSSSRSPSRHSSSTPPPRPYTKSPHRQSSAATSPRPPARSLHRHSSTTVSPRTSRSPHRHTSTATSPIPSAKLLHRHSSSEMARRSSSGSLHRHSSGHLASRPCVKSLHRHSSTAIPSRSCSRSSHRLSNIGTSPIPSVRSFLRRHKSSRFSVRDQAVSPIPSLGSFFQKAADRGTRWGTSVKPFSKPLFTPLLQRFNQPFSRETKRTWCRFRDKTVSPEPPQPKGYCGYKNREVSPRPRSRSPHRESTNTSTRGVSSKPCSLHQDRDGRTVPCTYPPTYGIRRGSHRDIYPRVSRTESYTSHKNVYVKRSHPTIDGVVSPRTFGHQLKRQMPRTPFKDPKQITFMMNEIHYTHSGSDQNKEPFGNLRWDRQMTFMTSEVQYRRSIHDFSSDRSLSDQSKEIQRSRSAFNIRECNTLSFDPSFDFSAKPLSTKTATTENIEASSTRSPSNLGTLQVSNNSPFRSFKGKSSTTVSNRSENQIPNTITSDSLEAQLQSITMVGDTEREVGEYEYNFNDLLDYTPKNKIEEYPLSSVPEKTKSKIGTPSSQSKEPNVKKLFNARDAFVSERNSGSKEEPYSSIFNTASNESDTCLYVKHELHSIPVDNLPVKKSVETQDYSSPGRGVYNSRELSSMRSGNTQRSNTSSFQGRYKPDRSLRDDYSGSMRSSGSSNRSYRTNGSIRPEIGFNRRGSRGLFPESSSRELYNSEMDRIRPRDLHNDSYRSRSQESRKIDRGIIGPSYSPYEPRWKKKSISDMTLSRYDEYEHEPNKGKGSLIYQDLKLKGGNASQLSDFSNIYEVPTQEKQILESPKRSTRMGSSRSPIQPGSASTTSYGYYVQEEPKLSKRSKSELIFKDIYDPSADARKISISLLSQILSTLLKEHGLRDKSKSELIFKGYGGPSRSPSKIDALLLPEILSILTAQSDLTPADINYLLAALLSKDKSKSELIFRGYGKTSKEPSEVDLLSEILSALKNQSASGTFDLNDLIQYLERNRSKSELIFRGFDEPSKEPSSSLKSGTSRSIKQPSLKNASRSEVSIKEPSKGSSKIDNSILNEIKEPTSKSELSLKELVEPSRQSSKVSSSLWNETSDLKSENAFKKSETKQPLSIEDLINKASKDPSKLLDELLSALKSENKPRKSSVSHSIGSQTDVEDPRGIYNSEPPEILALELESGDLSEPSSKSGSKSTFASSELLSTPSKTSSSVLKKSDLAVKKSSELRSRPSSTKKSSLLSHALSLGPKSSSKLINTSDLGQKQKTSLLSHALSLGPKSSSKVINTSDLGQKQKTSFLSHALSLGPKQSSKVINTGELKRKESSKTASKIIDTTDLPEIKVSSKKSVQLPKSSSKVSPLKSVSFNQETDTNELSEESMLPEKPPSKHEAAFTPTDTKELLAETPHRHSSEKNLLFEKSVDVQDNLPSKSKNSNFVSKISDTVDLHEHYKSEKGTVSDFPIKKSVEVATSQQKLPKAAKRSMGSDTNDKLGKISESDVSLTVSISFDSDDKLNEAKRHSKSSEESSKSKRSRTSSEAKRLATKSLLDGKSSGPKSSKELKTMGTKMSKHFLEEPSKPKSSKQQAMGKYEDPKADYQSWCKNSCLGSENTLTVASETWCKRHTCVLTRKQLAHNYHRIRRRSTLLNYCKFFVTPEFLFLFFIMFLYYTFIYCSHTCCLLFCWDWFLP